MSVGGPGALPAGERSLRQRVPDASQGPGPTPARLVDALDVDLGRLVSHALSGARSARGAGVGTELAQLRAYAPGDDPRHVDAAASARTATLQVRVHVPERALTSWLVLDLSPSMAFGTGLRLKSDVAHGAALVLARVGLRRAGSVGVVAFGVADVPGGVRVLPPRGAKPGLVAVRKLLDGGVAPDSDAGLARGTLADAAAHVLALARLPGLIVVISDFRDQQGWERALGALRLRHAVVALEVSDPAEAVLPRLGRLALVDPESGLVVRADTAGRRLGERFAALESERREALSRELRRLGIRHVCLSTAEDWLAALGRGLR